MTVIVGGSEITPVFAGRAQGLPGADQINLALRAPWDLAVLDHLATAKDQFAP